MNYQQILPEESLRNYVRYFWVLEDDSNQDFKKTFRILPDGLPGLVFQHKASYSGQNGRRLPQLFVYGQTTKHSNQQVNENFCSIGVYFQPTALKSIFGIDACELTNQEIDLCDLGNSLLLEQLSNKENTLQQIQLLSTFFLKQIDPQKTVCGKVIFAIEQMNKGNSLREIQSQMNVSERTLERYFRQHAGISPKQYSKIVRFQSALNEIRKPVAHRLTDIAYQNDYFDQSHFIREFKEFTGTSPRQFLVRSNEQVANFPEWKC